VGFNVRIVYGISVLFVAALSIPLDLPLHRYDCYAIYFYAMVGRRRRVVNFHNNLKSTILRSPWW